ncbi:MAG: hypothetical protein H7Y13_13805 [Sphingobacteriaceae bacterium]|nr:hypothetical protein [Sphingobacteriaceae bacterium]
MEKGKNRAIIDDIGKITNEIESVKILYTKESAEVQHKLTHLVSIHSSHRNEERVALIQFYEAYTHWMFTIFEIPIESFHFSTLPKLYNEISELNLYFKEVNKSSSKMILLVNNPLILDKGYALISQLIRYKSWAETYLLQLSFKLEDQERLHTQFMKLNADYVNNELELKKIAEWDTQNRWETSALKQKYKSEKLQEFINCKILWEEFAALTKQYLISIE